MASSSSSVRYAAGQLDTERMSGSGECKVACVTGVCGVCAKCCDCGEDGTIFRLERHMLLLLAKVAGFTMAPEKNKTTQFTVNQLKLNIFSLHTDQIINVHFTRLFRRSYLHGVSITREDRAPINLE